MWLEGRVKRTMAGEQKWAGTRSFQPWVGVIHLFYSIC